MHIKRHVTAALENWKTSPERMPLILRGARQVGKTFLVKDFSKSFPAFYEFNFQKNPDLKNYFLQTNDPKKIIERLSIFSQADINIDKDLIFFDEIQDCPEALNSLKFFCENYPKSYIMAAGSLLGIYLSNHSFPVGKVTFQNVFPLSFAEYLDAIGEGKLSNLLFQTEISLNLEKEIKTFHAYLVDCLRTFFVLGGMPKIVSNFYEAPFSEGMRQEQLNLLLAYRADFSKYSGPVDALRILSVFENIPKQLAKDNRKFQFTVLKKGSRYSEFASAIDWLVSAGLCYKVPILEHVEIPLKVALQENIFKLYFFDVGLLGALSDLPQSAFSNNDRFFSTFKGAFAENYFLQEFRSRRVEAIYSWVGKTSEVDFLFSKGMNFYPIEVKSGESGKLKSLNVFSERFNPPWRTRCSLKSLEVNTLTQFRNFPLYLASRV